MYEKFDIYCKKLVRCDPFYVLFLHLFNDRVLIAMVM
jgi:hypothetical protein